ncbi:MAG TPA: fatty acid oxidation complex subunit alpha FadJ [Fredinandcohnia sp.]|nr:fatty acid oxidation complex subunit alpha FadJ [Fredinandcohnia sp.]
MREPDYRLLRVERLEGGVAHVVLDDPDEPVNTISEALGEEIQRLWPALQSDESVRAILISSGKRGSFVAGAKLEMIQKVRTAEEAEKLARFGQAMFDEIAASRKPVVVAIEGAALGGGLELALACHYRLASLSKATKLGLPETQLGLIPGAGGTQRLPRLVGIEKALDLILTGKQVDARRALKMGLVDEAVPEPLLLQVAIDRARALGEGRHPTKARRGGLRPPSAERLRNLALEENPLGRRLLFNQARKQALQKSRGHYPAIPAAIEAVQVGIEQGMRRGLEKEAELFGQLAVSDVSRQLVRIFFAQTALKKETGVDDPAVRPREVKNIGMIGAGLMGGGIAYVSAAIAGIPVRFKERDDEALARGFAYVRRVLDDRVRRRRITHAEREEILHRVTGATRYEGFGNMDLVIEAVFEDLDLKHRVIRELEEVIPAHCIIASNTSTLPISRLAEASKRPENVVGMHYFSPVEKMPLLEVIRGKKTAPEVIATAVAVGKAQGKTVIVVDDGPGFYTSRILAPYMMEAAWLLAEGGDVEQIDRAMRDWGFPVGPFTLLDEVGIDVGQKVTQTMVSAFGDRMLPPEAFERVVADGRLGRKNKKGFYLYGGKKKGVDPTVYDLLGEGRARKRFSPEEIQERLYLQMCNEAALCLQEGILRSPRDGDVGAIFGLGFPPFRGGPFRWMDTLGTQEVVRRLRIYEERIGHRFRPAQLLVDMAREGKSFYP